MKHLPLKSMHEHLGARMGQFAGWYMPMHYGSAVREVEAVRRRVGLFDISHMGRLELSGSGASSIFLHLCSNNVDSLKDGEAQYTLFLNSSGGVIDDAVVYRNSPKEYYIVVNASNTERDLKWLSTHITDDVLLANWTKGTVFLALQGPLASQIMENVGAKCAVSLKRFSFTRADVGNVSCVISRTGYTGEDGFEIVARAEDGEQLWRTLQEIGGDALSPCGLAARDVLRIEAGYPLYGHEIDDVTNPVEARLMRFVKIDDRHFVGKAALMEAVSRPQPRTLIGLVMDDRSVPRDGHLIFAEGSQIGYVSSGTFSPTIRRGIALAFIEREMASKDQRVEVQVGDSRRAGTLKKPPLYARRD